MRDPGAIESEVRKSQTIDILKMGAGGLAVTVIGLAMIFAPHLIDGARNQRHLPFFLAIAGTLTVLGLIFLIASMIAFVRRR